MLVNSKPLKNVNQKISSLAYILKLPTKLPLFQISQNYFQNLQWRNSLLTYQKVSLNFNEKEKLSYFASQINLSIKIRQQGSTREFLLSIDKTRLRDEISYQQDFLS